MPELGKATYYLIANTTQFDAAMAHADEVAAASSTSVNRSLNREAVAMDRLAVTSGVSTAKISAGYEAQAEAAAASSAKVASSAEKSAVVPRGGGGKGTLGALAALAVVGYEGFKAMKAYSLSSGLLDNALKNAGATAGVTRKQLNDLTNSIFDHSKETKADIMMSEQLALRFQEVHDKSRLVKDAVDASAVTGRSLQTVTLALGRALENPSAGLTRLARAGISFSKAQIDMVKNIEATKGPLAAQAAIYALVEHRVRGAAEEAAKHQPWRVLARDFQEISREILSHLIPAFKFVVKQMDEHKTVTKALVIALVALAAAVVAIKLVSFISGLKEAVVGMNLAGKAAKVWAAMQWLVNLAMDANPIILIGVAIVGLTILILKLTGHLASVKTIFGDVWKFVQKVTVAGVEIVIQSVKTMAYLMLQEFTLVIRGVLGLASKLPFVGGYAKKALDGINDFIGKFKPDWGQVKNAWNNAGEGSGQSFGKGAKAGIKGSTPGVVSAATQMGQQASQAVQDAVSKGDVAATMLAGGTGLDIMHAQQTQTAALLAAFAAKQKAIFDKMKSTALSKLDEMMNALKQKVEDSKTSFTSAFGNLASTAFQAFDAVTQAGLDKFDRQLNAFTSKIDKAVSAFNAMQDKYAATPGPAQTQLNTLEAQHQQQQLQQALTDAQRQLATAKTPDEVMSAQRAIADAQYSIQIAALQKQADTEQAARQKQADDAKTAYAAQAEAQKTAYAARIEQEKKDYQSERELYKQHLQKWLNQEMAWLTKHPAQWGREWKKIAAVFGPDVQASAKLIGRGFIGSFSDAVATAGRTALRLSASLAGLSRGLGGALADGILSGFRKLGPQLYNEMVHAINTAIANFKKQYQITSPSKVTADQMGKPLAQGVVLGYTEEARKNPLTPTAFGDIKPGAFHVVGEARTGAALRTAMATSPLSGDPDPRLSREKAQQQRAQINMEIHTPKVDPWLLLRDAQFAAEGVFG